MRTLPFSIVFSNTIPLEKPSKALDVRYAGNVGYLRRASTSPTTDADLVLPTPGSSGSLSEYAAIVINTNVARAVMVNTSLTDGSYGVGQEMILMVSFTASVGVNG